MHNSEEVLRHIHCENHKPNARIVVRLRSSARLPETQARPSPQYPPLWKRLTIHQSQKNALHPGIRRHLNMFEVSKASVCVAKCH